MFEHDIKICTPYYNLIDEKVQQGIYDVLDSKELNCAWIAKQGTAIAATRNMLVNELKSDLQYQKLNDDFTHYLFVDADVVIDVDTIKKLLNYNLDIVERPPHWIIGSYKIIKTKLPNFRHDPKSFVLGIVSLLVKAIKSI